jgi:hypothetical protein
VTAAEGFAHCPNCLAEYRAGFTICTDCGSLLVPGPTPASADPTGCGRVEIVTEDDPPADRDRFALEATPVVLTSIVEEDVEAFLSTLEDEEIGARRGAQTSDGGVEIVVHAANVMDAQAVLVEFTGDVSLVDDIGLVDEEPETDADMAVVTTARLQDAGVQANRLRERGIDVRIEMPRHPSDGAGEPRAAILVPWDQLDDARGILGIEL